MMKIILKDIEPHDWILGVRAAKWMAERFQKYAIVSYSDGDKIKDFYAKRNKASITVQPCARA